MNNDTILCVPDQVRALVVFELCISLPKDRPEVAKSPQWMGIRAYPADLTHIASYIMIAAIYPRMRVPIYITTTGSGLGLPGRVIFDPWFPKTSKAKPCSRA